MGRSFIRNPEITGRALALLLGRKAPEVVEWIMEHLTPEARAQEAERAGWASGFVDDDAPQGPPAPLGHDIADLY